MVHTSNRLNIVVRNKQNFAKEHSIKLKNNVKVYKVADYKSENLSAESSKEKANKLRNSFNSTDELKIINISLLNNVLKDENNEIRNKDFELVL